MSLYLVYQHNPTFGTSNLIAAFSMKSDCDRFLKPLRLMYDREGMFSVAESIEHRAWNALHKSAMEQA